MRTVEEIKADIDNFKYPKFVGEFNLLQLELYGVITNGIPLDRLETICAAEKDGRCAVMPCKVGDTVYKICCCVCGVYEIIEGKIIACHIEEENTELYFSEVTRAHNIWIKPDYFGTTVFLTRAEAEKALEEKQ